MSQLKPHLNLTLTSSVIPVRAKGLAVKTSGRGWPGATVLVRRPNSIVAITRVLRKLSNNELLMQQRGIPNFFFS